MNKVQPIFQRTMQGVQEDGWIKTSRRAADAKPWDQQPLDDKHFVRKVAQSLPLAKKRIETYVSPSPARTAMVHASLSVCS
jgi:hypothetical protein